MSDKVEKASHETESLQKLKDVLHLPWHHQAVASPLVSSPSVAANVGVNAKRKR